MELRYIWIKEYKNIIEQEFNFSNDNSNAFTYEKGFLLIQNKEDDTPQKFFSENITGITGIVGANGAGKTNLFEFLNYNLSHVTNGGLSVYIDSKGIIILDKWIFIQDEIPLENESELVKEGFEISRYERAPFDKGQNDLMWHEMERNKYIYYNPVFDFRPIRIWGNFVNISTSYLVYNDVSDSAKTYGDDKRSSNLYYKTSQLEAFYRRERDREAEFVLKYGSLNELIDFIPNRVAIIIDHLSDNQLLQPINYFKEEKENKPKLIAKRKLLSQIDELERVIGSEINQFLIEEKEKHSIDVYKIKDKQRHVLFKNTFLLRLFKMLILHQNIILKEDSITKFIYYGYDVEVLGVHRFSQTIDRIIECLDILLGMDTIKEVPIEIFNYTKHDSFKSTIKYEKEVENLYRSIVISTNHKEIILDFINEVRSLLNNETVLHYELVGKYSSGQQQILNFYSRFYYAYRKIKEDEAADRRIEGESIVLFIDEGEVALHPEWQRLFFDKAMTFLSKLFSDYKVQIILTTHSPFVISELPKQNVLFLKKDKEGNSKQLFAEMEKTFSANIHELLADSFFMTSTMGAFSEKKIKKIVDFYYKIIQAEDLIDLREEYVSLRNEFHFITESIGDDVIANIVKNHLSSIENKLFPDDTINYRIKKLENEIELLKRRKK